jgi:hypothetical protein
MTTETTTTTPIKNSEIRPLYRKLFGEDPPRSWHVKYVHRKVVEKLAEQEKGE